MRVLHVIHSIDPKYGGPVEGIRQIGQWMKTLGHDIEVLTADAPESEYLKSFPLVVHAVGPVSGLYSKTPNIEAWLRENGSRFDALIAEGIWTHPNLGLRRAAKQLRKPYWVYTHGMLDPWFNRAYPLKRLKKQLYWPLQHAVLRDAEAVLFTCEEERLLARKSFRPYQVRERVVSYGTAAPPVKPETQREAFAQIFPDLLGQRFLLFLGRIHPKKGVDLLLSAFAAREKADPGLHLAIAGPSDPNYRAELERIVAGHPAEKRVHWLGMLQGATKWGAFRSAEAFVLPSHQENFGIAVVEALACGTPVLITHPVNIWREIESDRAGLIDEDTLQGVLRLLQRWQETSSRDREAMSLAALECLERRFTIDFAAKSLISTLEDGIEAYNGRREIV